jgi:hypothetical protein
MYPDSPAGLQRFVVDLLDAIINSDNAKVESLWQSTILPAHAVWFATIFGEKEGGSIEANYAKRLANTPYAPGKAYTFTASLDQVKVLVLPLAQARVLTRAERGPAAGAAGAHPAAFPVQQHQRGAFAGAV